MRKITIPGILIGLLAVTAGYSDEGMWQPSQLPDISDKLKEKGLTINANSLADLTRHPMNAVIGLGFCTASFVSPSGLVVTNHHCAYSAIQFNSTDEKNLLADGFLAEDRKAELPAPPTMRVYVTRDISDVTEQVNDGLNARMSGEARYNAIDLKKKQLVAECEKDPGHRCEVYTFFGGYRYQLIKQLEIRDIRLVYAPSENVGKYGGDIDNWIWPRHTGDFAFFRAYVAPDGSAADYAEENVPYQPESHLEVNPNGLSSGDFTMVIGYPGSTSRYRLAREVGHAINWLYPARIETINDWLEIIDETGSANQGAAIKYAATVASLNNVLKNSQGMLDGFAKDDVVGRREGRQQSLRQWVERDQTRASLYLNLFRELDDALAAEEAASEGEQRYNSISRFSAMLRTAKTLYRLSIERDKPDLERESGYQERDWPRIKGRLQQLDRRYHPEVDKAVLSYNLKRYRELLDTQRIPALDRWLGETDQESLEQRLTQMYSQTRLGELEARLDWMERPSADFEASEDPFIALAVALYPDDSRLEKEKKARDGELQKLRSGYMDALLAYQTSMGESIYDDANNSLRVSYGSVVGYSPADAVEYQPFTRLEGIAEKHTGEDPFDATSKQMEAIRDKRYGPYLDAKLDSVPVNFLASLDITGGNSGSPTLDSQGRLVGLAFDGNYESINADWAFNPSLTRSIHVDIRYMLWVMDAVDSAHDLIREMGLKPAFDFD